MKIETAVLKNLVHNEEYCRKVVPFLNREYFSDKIDRAIYDEFVRFFDKYNKPATQEILKIEIGNSRDLYDKEFTDAVQFIETDMAGADVATNVEWLTDETEAWCKKRAVYLAIMDSIKIIDGRDKARREDAIPSLLQDALSVSFDKSVGHDLLDDYQARYDFYHRVEEKLAFDIDMLNTITKGGLSRKTLNIILAGTGVGKSLAMCHFAGAYLMQGLNVLYVTMEMAEERIAERIDANLLNLSMDELSTVDKKIYETRVGKLQKKTQGKLIVKEYPTSTAHSGHIRALIEELKMKRGFIPDVIFVDYLNICSSQRLKGGAGVNSYTYVKAIAEELRGLAVEYNVPLVSATQTTRSGFNSSDVGLEDTSESFGLPATADLMLALISTEELQELDQIMVKQLKNRYSDPNYYKRFVIGVDKSKMKLYNVEASAQEGLSDVGQTKDVPAFDISRTGKRIVETEGFKF
jgi:replicative DNA helicase